LRKNQTEAEEILWQLLRNRKLGGFKFRRQHPISEGFILDFYCPEVRLAIELDGAYHKEEKQQEYDEGRTYELEKYGIKVIRFWNSEIENSAEQVLTCILKEANQRRKDLNVLIPRSPLQKGEGENVFSPGSLSIPEKEQGNVLTSNSLSGEEKNYNLTTIYNLIGTRFTIQQANELINSLKICDPAVGSGHFLVSALNEILAIKSELGILCDRQGRRLREYHVEVVNDELIVTDEDGELFEYNPNNKESQRIQETLFHEKQTIIENCLFGVDINPNSVKICRLRLWIELLKSAYYKTSPHLPLSKMERGPGVDVLETLPNIDINIKCGNSLVSRFAIDADLRQALKKSKFTIDSYRVAVATYRNAESKEQKREMERLIAGIKSDFRSEISLNDPRVKKLRKLSGELFQMTSQPQLFEMSKKEKADWNKKVQQLTNDTRKIETEIEEIKANRIYENAFEWRFEFPEVLNDDGDFVGFDVVIGNPPYIRQEELAYHKTLSAEQLYHLCRHCRPLCIFCRAGDAGAQKWWRFYFHPSQQMDACRLWKKPAQFYIAAQAYANH
jgi:very-short-patch-repair endonuclease